MKTDLKSINPARIIPYLVPLVSVLLSVLLLSLIVIPRYRGISKLRNDLDSKKSQLKTLKTKSDKLAKLNSSISVIKKDDELFTQVIPDEEEIPTLMSQVQKVVEESGVTIKTLVFARRHSGAKSEKSEALLVSLQSTVTGSFATTQTFLENIEKASRILTVDDLAFNSSGAEINANIRINAYYFLPEPATEKEPVILNLNSSEFGEIVGKAKNLKHYETVVDVETGIGKEDPFR